MFEAESMELSFLGRFNPEFPLSMPWLSKRSYNYTFFKNIKSQPYTTWSAAGMFVTQCGFPLIFTDVHWNVRGSADFKGYDRLPCIPDYLRSVGYKLFAYCSGSCEIMHMKDFLKQKGYATQDSAEHFKTDDDGLFELLEGDVLKKLSDQRYWPFILLILNADTHPDFYVGAKCRDHLASQGYPMEYRSFTCFDDNLRQFTKAFKKSKLVDNTDIVIYGDHLTMTLKEWKLLKERNLTIFFPLRKQDEKWRIGTSKPLSYYDFAPTIMEYLGIDFHPPFPFGADIFSEPVGTVPTMNDMKLIYGLVSGDIDYKQIQCLGTSGFCRGEEF
jgi:phosphoglycerol transferase MdoB-like AlkP superfamily enzyme